MKKNAKKNRDLGLQIHWIKHWTRQQGLTDEHFLAIKTALAKGYPVAAGSNHSRLLVGYADDREQPGGGLFYTKDSGSGLGLSIVSQIAQAHGGYVDLVDKRGGGAAFVVSLPQ